MKGKWLGSLVGIVLMFMLTSCGAQSMAPALRYTTAVTLLPSRQPQTRTIQFRPDHYECRAIAQVRPDLKDVRCYDVLTLHLVTSQRRGSWTQRYASIRQCVARLTPDQLKKGCVHAIEICANARDHRCPPAWTAQTSIEFRTDGHRARKEWIMCGMGMWHEFRYRLNWCGATSGLPPTMQPWLSAGDDYEVRIPNVVQVGTEERIMLRPDGALVFGECC